ncbi:MAG: hypothetical protein JWL85_314, partial [Candidatus Saccharibacteria bacterium]|nr:hypothetical protein [Candidatus Saccharibacteria bacterium]
RRQLFILDWAGASVWYWSLGPLYQFLTITFNTPQLTLNAFAFFWEVPVMVGTAILLSQYRFRPVHAYLTTGKTDEPEKLYRKLAGFPKMVVFRTSAFTILGYAVGAWQLHHYTGLPTIEVYKDIGNGVVLSLYLALFYYLAVDQLLGQVRTRVRRQYHLQVPVRKFYQRIFNVVLLITLGSLSLIVLMGVQSFQSVIKHQLVMSVQNEMRVAVAEVGLDAPLTPQKQHFRSGEHGQSWVLSPTDALPFGDVLPESKAFFEGQSKGVIEDRKDEIKLIVFQTEGNQKMVSLIYPTDFYEALRNVTWLLALGGLFVAALASAVTTLFYRILTGSTSRLIDAVHEAKRTGTYTAPPIHTGDEFETLSDAYKTFIDQAHEERTRLQASIESLNVGFIMTDTHSHVVMSNHVVSQILGNPGQEGWGISAVEKCFDDALDLLQICQNVIQGKHHHAEREVTAGSKIIRIFVAPIAASKERAIGAIILIQDITEEKVLARSKDEFFSIASHELRTPLTAIRGNTSMIQQYYPEHMKDPALAEMVGDIHDSSIRLIQIVNDFLDLSRLEQGRMVYQNSAFNVDKVIEGVLYEMNAVVKKKHLYLKADQYTLDQLPEIWADKDRTKQIVYNLIGNALKFTEEGGVTVSAERTDGHVKITISDTGPGISKEDQKLLFHKFQQAAHSILTRDATGTGLGLYISKVMTEDMGGKLRLESSEVGKGTAFSFTLPIATVDQKQKQTKS